MEVVLSVTIFGEKGLSFIVMYGPAVRSYGGLPALQGQGNHKGLPLQSNTATIPLPSGLFWMVGTN